MHNLLNNRSFNNNKNNIINRSSFGSDRCIKHPKANIYQQKFHDLIQNDFC
jgi:hypothetical protein